MKTSANQRRGAKGMVLLLIMVVGVSAMGMSLALLQRARWPGPLASGDEVQLLAAKLSLKPLIEQWARVRLKKDAQAKPDLRTLLHAFSAEDQFETSSNTPLFRAVVRKEPPKKGKNAEIWQMNLGRAGLSFVLLPPRKNAGEDEKTDRLWVRWNVISPRQTLIEPGDPPSLKSQGVGLLRLGSEGIMFSAQSLSPLFD